MAETFLQAANFTPTNGRQIDLIVVHDMEAPEGPTTAENVAQFFHNQTPGDKNGGSSAHQCFDSDSQVRCVQDRDVAWHAPGVNHNGIGYEHAGYARQTRAEWLDDFSRATLIISARQAALDCRKYGLPIVFVDAAGLNRGDRGITTHLEATRAFKPGGHTDPGPGFPMDLYLQWVRDAYTGTQQEDDDVLTKEQEVAIFNTDRNTKEISNKLTDVTQALKDLVAEIRASRQ
jgi:hypothetical protein